MQGRGPLCATCPYHRGNTGKDPVAIQSFSLFTREEASNSAQRTPFSCHTLKVLRGSKAPFSLINPRLEPRAPSHGNAHGGDSVPGSTPLTVCTVVYPGGGRVVHIHQGIPPTMIPGTYTPGYTSHRGTRAVYTPRVYLPPWYPGCMYHLGYTSLPWYPGCMYHPGYVPPVVCTPCGRYTCYTLGIPGL